MKTIGVTFLALALLAGAATEANAVVCARGVYRAGCAGPHGTVVAPRPYGGAVVHPAPYGAAVVRPAAACYWRAGVRICR